MEVIKIDDLEYLFKNKDAFLKFKDILKEHVKNDMTSIYYKDKLIGVLMSEKTTEQILYDRLVKRIIDSPNFVKSW